MHSVFLKAQTNTTKKLSQKLASKWTFILLWWPQNGPLFCFVHTEMVSLWFITSVEDAK